MVSMVARRSVLGAVSFASAVALAGLVGCGAAPEDSSAESSQALPRGGLGVGGGGLGNKVVDPPPPPPPVCPPSNEFPYAPNITTSTNWCNGPQSVWNGPRTLDTTNSFESQLKALGCTDAVSAVAGLTVPPGGTGWSFTQCPDTCEVRQLVHAWHWQNPVASVTSNVRVTACSGTPATGHIFAVWDPRCPSTCQLPNDI